jgi:ubiquinone/menaquinone biosynthesis C-methylase UbiE
MHLADPTRVIAEMARVVRPGGRVMVVEPDSEVVLLDSGLVDVTRRLLAYRPPATSARGPAGSSVG